MAIEKLDLRLASNQKNYLKSVDKITEYVNLQRKSFEEATQENTKEQFYWGTGNTFFNIKNAALEAGFGSETLIDYVNERLESGDTYTEISKKITREHPYTRRKAAIDFFDLPLSQFPLSLEWLASFLKERLFVFFFTAKENKQVDTALRKASDWPEAYEICGIRVWSYKKIKKGNKVIRFEKVKLYSSDELRQIFLH